MQNKRQALRRLQCLMLSLWLLLFSLLPNVYALVDDVGNYVTVHFRDYDRKEVQTVHDVPIGAMLFSIEDLKKQGLTQNITENAQWYLYRAADSSTKEYGPVAIKNPTREGYTFFDWAAEGYASGNIHTVQEQDTGFVARYSVSNHYVLNLYYQFDNENQSTAAETATGLYVLGDAIDIALPVAAAGLDGLAPTIKTPEGASEAQKQAIASIGKMIENHTQFKGTMDTTFWNNCVEAGFAERDENGSPKADSTGNIQIAIPITYVIPGEVSFTVRYLQQNTDNDEYSVVETVTHKLKNTVSADLRALDLDKTYEGFTATAETQALFRNPYTVRIDGQSQIDLKYDRNIHYLYYQMQGAAAREPVAYRFGATLYAPSVPTHSGYTFEGWEYKPSTYTALPATMPNEDLYLTAKWTPTDTTFTAIYWLENANDAEYSSVGYCTVPCQTGQTVDQTMLAPYVTADGMKQHGGIQDAAFFTYQKGDFQDKVVSGDGSTVVNLYFARNSYKLEFCLGKYENSTYSVSDGGRSLAQNTLDGFRWVSVGSSAPTITKDGKTYTVAEPYTITAKYEQNIADLWPTAGNAEKGIEIPQVGGWNLFTWGTTYDNQYYNTHDNKNIMGIYATMSKDLILNSSGQPMEKHILVAYWSQNSTVRRHHFLFEAVDGADITTIVDKSAYQAYTKVNASGPKAFDALPNQFYEYRSIEVRTTAAAAAQNAVTFPNMQYAYGCYSGDDAYFFYTYNRYPLIYNERNPDKVKKVDFIAISGKTLAQTNPDTQFNYTPDALLSEYGNHHKFGGWFLDAECTLPMDWSAPQSAGLSLYAKWIPPTFSVTLRVPQGSLAFSSQIQERIGEQGFTFSEQREGEQGLYTIGNVPEGYSAAQLDELIDTPVHHDGLEFEGWQYESQGRILRYLFDPSVVVHQDLTLTAAWNMRFIGTYKVQYLSQTKPAQGDYGTLVYENTTYYRLQADKTVTDVAVGAQITENAVNIDGYLVESAAITQTIRSDGQTIFRFFYRPSTKPIAYYVHFVRSTGQDYGRSAPPPDAKQLAPTKTLEAPIGQTKVRAEAEMISGYSPRDGWSTSMMLSEDEGQNHIYFYYVSNTATVSYEVRYYFADLAGRYAKTADLTFQVDSQEALGKLLYASEYVQNYQSYLPDSVTVEQREALRLLMIGHTLDETLSDEYIIVRQNKVGDKQQNTINLLNIYMKLGQYSLGYQLASDENAGPFSWANPPQNSVVEGGRYVQRVTYPTAPIPPQSVPDSRAFFFDGWTTEQPGGNATVYQNDALSALSFFQPGELKKDVGLYRDITLYAKWLPKTTVRFDVSGGKWADDSAFFTLQPDGTYLQYLNRNGKVVCPIMPTRERAVFLGWTELAPAEQNVLYTIVGDQKKLDPVKLEQHRYYFDSIPTDHITLYAIWDENERNEICVKKQNTGGDPLSGAVFEIRRLRAELRQSGTGYEFVLTGQNAAQNYVDFDPSFTVQSAQTKADGQAIFGTLSPGYYLVREVMPPDGYVAEQKDHLVQIGYGDSGGTQTIQTENGVRQHQLVVPNLKQYGFLIDSDELTFTFTPANMIWNPVTLQYERETNEAWTSSQSVSVTNISESGATIYATAKFGLLPAYQSILQGSMQVGGAAYTQTPQKLEKNESVSFLLSLSCSAENAAQAEQLGGQTVGQVTISLDSRGA